MEDANLGWQDGRARFLSGNLGHSVIVQGSLIRDLQTIAPNNKKTLVLLLTWVNRGWKRGSLALRLNPVRAHFI